MTAYLREITAAQLINKPAVAENPPLVTKAIPSSVSSVLKPKAPIAGESSYNVRKTAFDQTAEQQLDLEEAAAQLLGAAWGNELEQLSGSRYYLIL